MSKRTILSRPRTRVYDANYNIGESMYRPALDRLNRKYSGRPLSPPPRQTKIPSDILERHDRAFFEDDLDNCRRRAEKHITAPSFYDSRGARLEARDLMDNFDDETVSRIKGIRASKKVSVVDDVNMESTVNNITARRFLDRTDKILDSIGIVKDDLRRGYEDEPPVSRRALQDSSRRSAYDEDVSVKRRSLRLSQEEDSSSREVGLGRWSARTEELEKESAASVRAKQSRARLTDLDDEMEAMAERQAERERKAARLKALIAEVAEENDVTPPISMRRSIRIKEQEEEEF